MKRVFVLIFAGLLLNTTQAFSGVIVSSDPIQHLDADTPKIYSESSGIKVKKIKVNSFFAVYEGELISDAVRRWAKKSGYKLMWEPPYTWKVVNDYKFKSDNLTDAVNKLMQYLKRQGKPVMAKIYSNKVLVIKQDDSVPMGGGE